MKKLFTILVLLSWALLTLSCDEQKNDSSPVEYDFGLLYPSIVVEEEQTYSLYDDLYFVIPITSPSLIWISDDISIALVDQNGIISGVSSGTTSIRVLTSDAQFSASCTVVVTAREEHVELSIELTPSATELSVGEYVQLVPIIEPESFDGMEVEWHTSDPDIAVVSEDGLVTAVSAGTVRITASILSGVITATSTITVTPLFIIPTITLVPDELVVKAGYMSHAITAIIEPEGDYEVICIYQEPYILAISESGWDNRTFLVTGTHAGTTTIKAVIAGYEDYPAQATATATVTVTPPDYYVSLSLTSIVQRVGNLFYLVAYINPDPGPSEHLEVVWTSTDPGVATVEQNGAVTAVSPGTTVITAAIEQDDGHSHSASCTVFVNR